MKRRHQVNRDLLLLGLPRRKKPLIIWSTSVVAALGLTGALALPIMAQAEESRKGDTPVNVGPVVDPGFFGGPVYVSADAPLNAFSASGKDVAIDGRPVGMVGDADENAEAGEESGGAEALLAGTVGELGKLPGGLRLMHPVSTRAISSPYGWRSNPTGPGNQIHIGQDYPIACGSPVYASEAGTVTVSAWAGHSGMRVTVDHGNNVQTGYSHNSSLIAKVGQRVEQGELIARSGTTGNSTGCHVHFEVIIDGRWNDPRNYLPVIAGQRQAMIDSQRLTVSANSAPKGNGQSRPTNTPNASNPDVIVPKDDTPVIPSPKPSAPKPSSPKPNHSESPKGTPTPGGSKSPDASQSPGNSATPDGSTGPSNGGPTGNTPTPGDSSSPSAPETSPGTEAPSTPEPSKPESQLPSAPETPKGDSSSPATDNSSPAQSSKPEGSASTSGAASAESSTE